MISGLLMFLVIADISLIVIVVRLNRRQTAHQAIMSELTEERTMLADLRSSIRADLALAQGQVKSMKEQVQLLATEAEQEVRSGVALINAEVDGIISELGARFDGPLNDLSSKQHYMENLLQRVQTERHNLARTTERAGALAKFFKDGVKFDDVMKELEDKKFSDIRALVAQGAAPAKVARELGITEQEVRLVAGLR
ncbi:MAG: hypothetical protein NTV34_11145 [Proteobacteria bacterium]|nr:hypothetical protein [Pseudomonadota bacterium]